LATIKNTIDTQFTSRGAKKVREETESIGKAQTRLGQGSASAGRSFSSQAQGLGGLVGVYAAAAANVFAISAAFEALNAAAKFQTTIRGTEQLAAALGTSAQTIIKDLQTVTDGQLSIVEAARSANIALSAGFGREQLRGLAEVATKASKTLGRDLNDSFQRITRGVIKLEPELLDELGIFTRIEPAVNDYAIAIGKSASQLTNYEKRQAFANGVLKDGTQAFKDITLAGDSTQKSFEQLVATFTNIAVVAGGLIADSLAPLADFLNDSLGNQLILVGSIGALVFGKLTTAVTVFVTGGLTTLTASLNGVAASMAAVSTSATAMAARTAAASKAFVGAGALTGSNRAFGSQFKKDIAAGPLSLGQAQQAQPKIVKALQAEKKERKDIKLLMKQANADATSLNRKLRQSAARSKALGMSLRIVRDQIALAGKGANILTLGLRGAATAAGFLAGFVNLALAAINYLIIAAVALQAAFKFFFDIDLYQKVLDFYRDITAESRQQKAGLEEINGLIDLQGSKYAEMGRILDEAGLDPSERTAGNVASTLDDLQEDALEASRTIGFLNSQIAKGVFSTLNNPVNFGFFTQGGLNDAKDEVDALKDKLIALNAQIAALAGIQALSVDFTNFSKFIGKAKEEVEGLTTALSKAFIKGQFNIDDGEFIAQELFRKVESGVTASQLTSPFADLSTQFDVDGAIYARQLQGLQLVRDEFDKYTKGSKAFIQAADASSDSFNKVQEIFTGLATDTISQENAGELLGIITDRIKQAQTIIKEAQAENNQLISSGQVGIFTEEQAEQAAQYIIAIGNGLEYIEERLKNTTELFIAQEKLFLSLNKQFSGVSTFIDEMGNTGAIDVASNKIATSQKEQLKFQRANFLILQERFEVLENMGETERKREARESEFKSLGQNLLLIAKSSFQESVKLLLTSGERLTQEEERVRVLRAQLNIMNMQNKEAVRQASIRERTARFELSLSSGQDNTIMGETFRRPVNRFDSKDRDQTQRGGKRSSLGFEGGDLGIDRMKRNLSSFDAIISREQRRVKLAEQRVALENEAASIERGMRMGAVQAKADAASGAGSLMVMRAEEAATIIEERSLSTTQEILDGRIAVMKAERDAELASIGGRAALAAEEFAQAKEEIQERRDTLLIEQQNQADAENLRGLRREDNLDIIRAERQQVMARKALEIFKVQKEKDAITARRDIAIAQANNERESKLFAIDQQIKEFQLLQFRIEADDKFLTRYAEITEGLAKALDITYKPVEGSKIDPTKDALKFIDKMLGREGFFNQQRGIAIQTGVDKTAAATSIATSDEDGRLAREEKLQDQLDQLKDLDALKKSMEDAETTFLEQEAQKQAEMIAMKLENLDLEDQAVKQAFDEKMSALGVEASIAKEAYRLAREAAEYDISQKKRMVELGRSLAFGISDTLGNAMMKFLTNLQEGKPLIEGIGELFTQMLFDIQQKILKASVIDPITTSLTDSLMGSFGKMSFFGGAAGGVVHMAEGGQVNALRDRVPAMLEPGEFVIRKSAAKSIGQSRLGQMNATGAGGMGNVQFNIVNNGAPKEAAQQGPPKIDTDKIVIDVVMRDLNSNGPIRKAMRSG